MPETPTSMFDLSGETAVVIGGTGALGGAIAEGLAQAGARVAVLGRNAARGAERVNSIRRCGGEAVFVPCDATIKESLSAAREAVGEELGEAAILVNAAGGNDPRVTVSDDLAFEDTKISDWAACFDLNLAAGVVLPCQVFGAPMASSEGGGGSIINIASISGHTPLTRVVAYSAAKAAVLSVTLFLAREWASRGVRVNSLTPGFFPGEQNRRLLFDDDDTPSARGRQILEHTPMERFGEPHELVGAAVFLASQRASGFVTGADIVVDGGFMACRI